MQCFFFFVKQIYILKKYCIIIMYVLCLKMYTVKQRRCYHLYISMVALLMLFGSKRWQLHRHNRSSQPTRLNKFFLHIQLKINWMLFCPVGCWEECATTWFPFSVLIHRSNQPSSVQTEESVQIESTVLLRSFSECLKCNETKSIFCKLTPGTFTAPEQTLLCWHYD